MNFLKWLLLPFSIIYLIITSIRNYFYDRGIFQSYSFKPTVICVGNLSVGGTGKSPMIEHLIQLYKEDYNLAVLSRGYKRNTKGFVEVIPKMTAANVGDEPLQFKRKFKDIIVCVDENRKNGIEQIEMKYPKTQIILLDDAFQHRRVKADINILLTTYAKPFYEDYILPVGRLRESKQGKKRADLIVVTKCPDVLSPLEKEEIKLKMNINNHQNVLFSKIRYDENIYSNNETLELENFNDFYLVTGIANPKPLVDFLLKKQKIFEHLAYPDHHNFTKKEIDDLNSLSKPILTTEKDFTRLHLKVEKTIYYIPIEVELDKSLRDILKLKTPKF